MFFHTGFKNRDTSNEGAVRFKRNVEFGNRCIGFPDMRPSARLGRIDRILSETCIQSD